MEWLSFLYTLVADFVKLLPRAIKQWRFERFFGKDAIEKGLIFAVLDTYEHPVPRQDPPVMRYIKNMPGMQPIHIIGEDTVLGFSTIQIVKYVSSVFSLYQRKDEPLKFEADTTVNMIWDSTLLCFGSGDSNQITLAIDNLGSNNLYSLEIGTSQFREWEVDGTRLYVVKTYRTDRCIKLRYTFL